MEEDDYMESKFKRAGEIYNDFTKMKSDLVIGQKPKDVL
jgi:hypothetical protein